MSYVNGVFIAAIAVLAVPITVVFVVAIGRIPAVLRSFRSLARGQPAAEQGRTFPRRFRRLICGSHLVVATLVLVAGIAWAVSALKGTLDYPLFNLAFAFWIVARVPLLYRESLLMASGYHHTRWMSRTDFVILAMGYTGAAILFGFSAWIETNVLAVVLFAALGFWAALNWYVVISKQSISGSTDQGRTE